MPMEVGILISALLGVAAAFRSASYGVAIFLSALVYLAVKLAFVIGGVIPEMAGGSAFTSGWFAELAGQLIPVVALGALVHRFTMPRPAV